LVLPLQLLKVRRRTQRPALWHGRRTIGRDRL
jgi:hypothetical protein